MGSRSPRNPLVDGSQLAGLSPSDQVDLICDAFESEWRSGTPRSTEEVLSSAPTLGNELLTEVLALEIYYRRRSGDEPSVAELSARFPDSIRVVNEVLTATSEVNCSTVPRNGTEQSIRSAPPVIDGFENLEKIGQGSFGTVYRAQDIRLGRIVAIKVAHPQTALSGSRFDRFLQEGRNVSRLSHPAIVPVFDMGHVANDSYIVSEYIDGDTLDVAMRERSFSHQESADILLQLAKAVDYAHTQQVIHRDLKPSNVILTKDAQGKLVAKVLDFGLARLTGDSPDLTAPGDILGTPTYMSPEQARGHGHEADERSDVYGLGAIFYELLSGEPPFRGKTFQVLQQVASQEPQSLQVNGSAIPRDLATICHKCLQKRPVDRYATCGELAADLSRWLTNRPILARRMSLLARGSKWVERNSILATVISLCLIIAVVGGTAFAIQRQGRAEADQRATASYVQSFLNVPEANLANELQVFRANTANAGFAEDFLANDDSLSEQDRAHLQLAMLPNSPAYGPQLLRYALDAASAGEFYLILQELQNYSAITPSAIVQIASERGGRTSHAFRSTLVLHELTKTHSAEELVGAIMPAISEMSTAQEIGAWLSGLEAHHDRLRQELTTQFHASSSNRPSDGPNSAALVYLCQDDVQALVNLVTLLPDDELWQPLQALQENSDSVTTVASTFAATIDRAEQSNNGTTSNHEMLWRNCGRLGSVLINLAGGETVWRRIAHCDDPRLRTYIVHYTAQSGISPGTLVEELSHSSQPDKLFSVLLAIGNLPNESLTHIQKNIALSHIKELFVSNPDGGVHSACRWVLTKWQEQNWLLETERALRNHFVDGRDWYVNSLGQTFVVIGSDQGPITAERFDGRERESWRHINWRIAVSILEVTYEDFVRWGNPQQDRFRPSDEPETMPVRGISAFEAMKFCSWLTEQDGIPTSEQAITWEGDTASVNPQKAGYRLPGSVEWSFACRSGSALDKYFGSAETPTEQYLSGFTERKPRQVGQLMPNRFGIFDSLDNLREWTLERVESVSEGKATWPTEQHPLIRLIRSKDLLLTLGGSYKGSPQACRVSGHRLNLAGYGMDDLGFRLVRTMPSSEDIQNN